MLISAPAHHQPTGYSSIALLGVILKKDQTKTERIKLFTRVKKHWKGLNN